MKKKVLHTILVILGSCVSLCAQGTGSLLPKVNPFLKMVGKPYGEYYSDYQAILDKIPPESADRPALLEMFWQAAETDKTPEWRLNARLESGDTRFCLSRKGGYTPSDGYTTHDHIADLLAIEQEAQKAGIIQIRIRALSGVATAYRAYSQEYDKAFTYYLKLTAELDKVSTADFPRRDFLYLEIARFYYSFQDYDNAIIYFTKVAEDPDAINDYCHSLWPAYNDLGLCYRSGPGDLQRSDSCFRLLLELPDDPLGVWKGIARGNLGYNQYLRGNYDSALPFLKTAISEVTRQNDFPYVSSKAVTVADIYLKKNNPRIAKEYIDLALDYLERSGEKDKDSDLTTVMSKYYMAVGSPALAAAYLDSALISTAHRNRSFSGLVLRRVEQQLNAAESALRQEELNAQKMRSRTFLWMTVSISVALLIVLALLLFYRRLYCKKRDAYAELARKARQWASNEELETTVPDGAVNVIETENGRNNNYTNIMDSDKQLVAQAHDLMVSEKLFKDTALSLESLSERLGAKRNVLSGAINRSTGKNFNQFVNDYRIKEAVRIISSAKHNNAYKDKLYEEVGFASRTTFYRIFKNITGLSPAEYKNNRKSM